MQINNLPLKYLILEFLFIQFLTQLSLISREEEESTKALFLSVLTFDFFAEGHTIASNSDAVGL